MPTSSVLFSANYLPAVSCFHAIHKEEYPLRLEKYEHYPKQTYRNRAKIATANGVLDLILPVEHGRKEHVAMKDIRINYDHDWQRLHWLSIQTAYRSSAYFEYYEDDFFPFFHKKYEFLFDYNVAQLELILKILKIDRILTFTDGYEKEPVDTIDYRTAIHPKKESIYPHAKPYYQLFEDRHGFIPDLSIIDLIFNQGPGSKAYL
ncbi:WbqC family protein [Sphingobacterium sp. SGG-5]|uniref:WbqC family protein n=1 Tax=Sphingobacterium sp. SGG-5 TaxID=2710881 RepID=UPI0013EC0434|nr:WbqC family protein [Sphingobacterium sp. SGG-5]NGM61561.1 WbqC family protein [Sphingobacterium sp. SGG-5]